MTSNSDDFMELLADMIADRLASRMGLQKPVDTVVGIDAIARATGLTRKTAVKYLSTGVLNRHKDGRTVYILKSENPKFFN